MVDEGFRFVIGKICLGYVLNYGKDVFNGIDLIFLPYKLIPVVLCELYSLMS